MTNPGNIVRIRSRNAGRASVYEANMWSQTFSTGLLSGNGVLQNTSANMNVLVGGSPSKPDVVIAKNPAGYNIALDIIGQQAIQITPPASNSRIASIVAYTNDLALASTDTATTGSPSSCGLIVVYGSASATPTPPTEATIRSAITADGATGSQAVYGVIADISVASSTTTITNALIGIKKAGVVAQNIDFTTFTSALTSNGTSIVLPSGGIYLVLHTVLIEQSNAAAASVYIYSITGMPSTTVTFKAGGQAGWSRQTNFSVIAGGTTVSRTSSTSTNVGASAERFVAIPLLQA